MLFRQLQLLAPTSCSCRHRGAFRGKVGHPQLNTSVVACTRIGNSPLPGLARGAELVSWYHRMKTKERSGLVDINVGFWIPKQLSSWQLSPVPKQSGFIDHCPLSFHNTKHRLESSVNLLQCFCDASKPLIQRLHQKSDPTFENLEKFLSIHGHVRKVVTGLPFAMHPQFL